MTLQWTLVATFLYIEIAVLCILLLPFVSPKWWRVLLNSRWLSGLSAYAKYYVAVFLMILAVLFADSIRELRKYNVGTTPTDATNPYAHDQIKMKLFLAQRNFYISGFALLLCVVIRRIAALLTRCGDMEASLSTKSSNGHATTDNPTEKDLPVPSAPPAEEIHEKDE